LLVSACSPSLNWREVQLPQTDLTAQMPCRPSKHARPVTLGQRARLLNLWSCSTDDATWGLAWIEDVEPDQLGETLIALKQGALNNVRAPDASMAEFRVPGAMSHAQAGRLKTRGQRPDGNPIAQDMALFAKGKTVYQATVLYSSKQSQGSEEFFGALRFTP
jgi:hypothetical protein